MKRRHSWSMRFALWVSAVFVLGAVASGGATYVLQSRALSQRLETDVQALAEALARTAKGGDRNDLVEQVETQTRVWRDGTTLVAFIDGKTGKTIGNMHIAAPFQGLRRLKMGRDISIPGAVPKRKPDSYQAFGIRTGLGWVLAARDESWVLDSGEVLLKATFLGLGTALLLTIGLAAVIARRNERRIVRMEEVLNDVRAGHLGKRIGDGIPDDLGWVASQIDATLDRLDAGIAAIRQVSTDVAHDLRAPLSRLRMRLESRVLDARLPAETRHEIGAALADLDGVTQTFDAILRLARLQSGSVDLHEEPVDLCALARETHDLLQASAEDAGHDLRLDLPTHAVTVTGDGEMLSQALINLVDNALRHCPSPAHVTMAVNDEGGNAIISVCDDGPGIPTEDRARVMERFVRLDRSRSTPGTGLGLSIVSAIAELHGAKVLLQDARPGLCVELVGLRR